jgi:hypothetical protein
MFIHTTGVPLKAASTAMVAYWQCAPKARITCGGGFHPENLWTGRALQEGMFRMDNTVRVNLSGL